MDDWTDRRTDPQHRFSSDQRQTYYFLKNKTYRNVLLLVLDNVNPFDSDILTLSILGGKLCRHIYIYYFHQKIGFGIPCKLSPQETVCIKNLFLEKPRKISPVRLYHQLFFFCFFFCSLVEFERKWQQCHLRRSPAYLFEVVFVKCVCIWRTSVFFQFYGVLSGVIYKYSPPHTPLWQQRTVCVE